MDPINYSGMLQPSQAGGIISDFFAKQVAQRKLDAYRNDIADAMANPTAQAFSALALKYPEQREAFKDAWGNLSAEQRDSDYLSGVQAYTALQNGKPEVAADILDKQIAARKNSGKDASKIEAVRSALDADPTSVQGNLGFILSAIDPEKWSKMTTAQTALEQAPEELRAKRAAATTAEAEAGVAPEMQAATLKQKGAEAAIKAAEADVAPQLQAANLGKTKAEIANISSQISDRVKRFDLDSDKLATETAIKLKEYGAKLAENAKPSDATRKVINEAAAASASAQQMADRAGDLLARIDEGIGPSGALASGRKLLNQILGDQDAVDSFRQQVNQLINSEILKGLPPGVASDRDISIFSKGYPSDTASADNIKSFLAGMQKLRRYEAATEDAKSEWVAQFGDLRRADEPLQIGEVPVEKGESFRDFSKKYAEKSLGASSSASNRVVYHLDTTTGQLIPEGQ